MGKHGQGGQSQNRFMRLHEEMEKCFYKEVAEATNQIFLALPRIDLLVIGGPSNTKDDFLKTNHLDYRLKKLPMKIVNIGYTDWSGLREAITKAEDFLAAIPLLKEKKIVDQFFMEVLSGNPKAIYGKQEVQDAIDQKRVEKMILTDLNQAHYLPYLEQIDYLLISSQTEAGMQLQQTFGGVGLWIRY